MSCWSSICLVAVISCFSFISVASAQGGGGQQQNSSNLNFIGSNFGVPGVDASFDYVIVGGGTAGLTVATRLAQSGAFSVALIEAGGFYEVDNGNLSVIPADAVFFTGASPNDTAPLVDWGFVTEPQAGLGDRKLHYARGKTLGGSSARNYFTYQRGTAGSYARWAEEVGDDSYQYDALLPYFQKSVHFTPPDNSQRAQNASLGYNHSAFSGDGGPLEVSIPVWANAFTSFVKNALNDLGLRTAVDFVSGSLAGVQYNMNTIDPRDQTRSSSESSFLRAALRDTALMVYKNSLATQILFSSDNNNTATGVLVNTAGATYTLHAGKEVILSAGTFQSPQLLMVSGIGPPETLRAHAIPLRAALPGVGQNLWDHLLFGPSLRVDLPTHSALSNPQTLAAATAQYRTNGSGPLGNPGGDLLAWEKYPHRTDLLPATRAALADFPPDWPELEHLLLDAYSGDHANYETPSPAPADPEAMYASAMVALVAPLSRGNVSISSSNMTDPPVLHPNWLTHPADQDLAVAAFKRIREYLHHPAMAGAHLEEVFPGEEAVATDDQILAFVRESAMTVFHAAGTCKMGRANDSTAVVDSRGRVLGVGNLRVVDAAVMPFLPPGHPQASVYALAEKIAGDILS